MTEYRESFKEFIIAIANMDSDNYSELSDLPEQAKKILLQDPLELDPWDLLNQAQAHQMKLEKRIQILKEKLIDATHWIDEPDIISTVKDVVAGVRCALLDCHIEYEHYHDDSYSPDKTGI